MVTLTLKSDELQAEHSEEALLQSSEEPWKLSPWHQSIQKFTSLENLQQKYRPGKSDLFVGQGDLLEAREEAS